MGRIDDALGTGATMSMWGVLGEPALLVARMLMVALVGFQLRRAMRRVRRRSGARSAAVAPITSGVPAARIVRLYNDALLSGWPAGERATFDEVADRAGTSTDHVRAVIDARRAA